MHHDKLFGLLFKSKWKLNVCPRVFQELIKEFGVTTFLPGYWVSWSIHHRSHEKFIQSFYQQSTIYPERNLPKICNGTREIHAKDLLSHYKTNSSRNSSKNTSMNLIGSPGISLDVFFSVFIQCIFRIFFFECIFRILVKIKAKGTPLFASRVLAKSLLRN